MGVLFKSRTEDWTVAVYTVAGDRFAAGVNMAVRPVQLTVPVTGIPPSLTVKLDDVTVVQRTSVLKIAVTVALRATLIAPSAGVVEVTPGPSGLGVMPASARRISPFG